MAGHIPARETAAPSEGQTVTASAPQSNSGSGGFLAPVSPAMLLRLQSSAGNAAVGALLGSRRAAGDGGRPSADRGRVSAPAALRESAASRRTVRRVAARRTLIQRSVGSPAGGCGICFPSPKEAGKAAHKIVQAELRRAFGHQIITEQMVPKATVQVPTDDDDGELDLLVPAPVAPKTKKKKGFLDVAVPSEGGYLIGEIKPANVAGILSADRQLLRYEIELEGFGFTTERLKIPAPPMSLPFIDPLAPECPQMLTVVKWPQPDGIYLYYCEPDFKDLVRRCPCRGGRRQAKSQAVAAQPAQTAPATGVTELEPELRQYQPAIEQQLAHTGLAGQSLAIVAPEDIYITLIGDPRAEKMLDRMRFHGLDPKRNPVIGYHHMWITMLGLAAATEATVVMAPIALELGAAGAAAGGTTAAAGGEVIAFTHAAAVAAEPLAKAAGVLLVVWSGTRAGDAHAQTQHVGAIIGVPVTELTVRGSDTLGLGASVEHNGRRFVVVGFAGLQECLP